MTYREYLWKAYNISDIYVSKYPMIIEYENSWMVNALSENIICDTILVNDGYIFEGYSGRPKDLFIAERKKQIRESLKKEYIRYIRLQ